MLSLFMLIPTAQNTSFGDQALPVRAFSALPKLSGVKLSPDGKKLVFMRNVEDQTIVVTLDIDKGEKKFIFMADNVTMKFRYAEWANN